jgi:phosphoesterase RecJ-like protein
MIKVMTNFKSFLDVIKTKPHIALLAHKDPDFDTLSACAALGLIAEYFGCSLELIIPNKEEIELDYFPFKIQGGFYNQKPDLLIICDTSSIDRIFLPEEFRSIPIAHFDHHQGGNIKATYSFVDNMAPSCCDLILKIITECDETLMTTEISQLLLDGLVADTLSFRTSGVRPETFERAAKMVRYGALPLTTHHRLTQKQQPSDFVFKAQLMSQVKIDTNASCAYVMITEQELINAHKTKGALEGIGNEILSGMFINTSVLIYAMNNGQTKVSLRSNTTNVYEIARINGGGGHICAAGFVSEKKPAEIISSLLEILTTKLSI